jgi:2-oxoglutarate dehydrogenase E1 component
MTTGTYARVLDDPGTRDKSDVNRILLCSGKVYYDLVRHRQTQGLDGVAIIRLEQLYPFPEQQLNEVLEQYPDDVQLMWVQEEPRNMGAWPFMAARYALKLAAQGKPLCAVSRAESASPATGSGAAHKLEQSLLLKEAFGGLKVPV